MSSEEAFTNLNVSLPSWVPALFALLSLAIEEYVLPNFLCMDRMFSMAIYPFTLEIILQALSICYQLVEKLK